MTNTVNPKRTRKRRDDASGTSEPLLAPPETPSTESLQGTDPKPPSKADRILALLQRPEGATLQDLVTETGWQPHTTRAALTGLRKKGHTITSQKADGIRRYRATAAQ